MSGPQRIERAAQPTMSVVRRRARRSWRVVTLVYLVALTTGTHWPRLQVGIGDGPPPDKVLHLFAFGGLTLLLWQCRFVTHIWIVGLIAAAWVVFDEWTQSLAVFRRQTSWEDVAAGLTGVVCAVMWLWATAPIGGQVARRRRSMFDQVVDARLSAARGWVAMVGVAGVDAIMAAAICAMFIAPTNRDPQFAILIALNLGFVFGVHDAFSKWWRREAHVNCASAVARPIVLSTLMFGVLSTVSLAAQRILHTIVLDSPRHTVVTPLLTVIKLTGVLLPLAVAVRVFRASASAKLVTDRNIEGDDA